MSIVILFLRRDEGLTGSRHISLLKQIAELTERPAIGKTQALRIGRPPVDGEVVEIGVVVGMVVEMALQSPVLAQLVIQIELTNDVGGIAGVVTRHQAHIGLNGKAVFKQLGSQSHLVFVKRVDVTIVIAEAQI